MNNETGYTRIRAGAARRQRFTGQNDRTHLELNDNLCSGTLVGTITTITPLHVGTGQLMRRVDLKPAPAAVPKDVDLIAAFFREGERLVVPGSSLKGAFRHLYEIITPSCLAQANRQQRAPEDLRPCYYRADTRQDDKPIELCPACRVFGAQGYMGQVYFQTAYTPEGTRGQVIFAPARWEPKIRPEHTRTRKVYTHDMTSAELAEPLEVLPAETELSLKMDYRNLTRAEIGLLLLVMGQGAPRIYPKLGGAKAHGFGAVEVSAQALYPVTQADYRAYDLTESVETDFQPYLDAALKDQALFQPAAWRDLSAALSQRPESF